MPELSFQIEHAEVVPFAMVPQLAFKLRVTNHKADEVIHTVALRCQVQIETTRRRYTAVGAGKFARSFWRARTVGADAEDLFMDAHQCHDPGLPGKHRNRHSGAV